MPSGNSRTIIYESNWLIAFFFGVENCSNLPSRLISQIDAQYCSQSQLHSLCLTGRPGRIVESSVTYENDRNLKESSYDARTSYYRSTVLPPQTVSPNCFFHPNTMNQEKRGGTEAASQPKPQFVPTQCNSAKPAELNPNPYVQSQHKVGIDLSCCMHNPNMVLLEPPRLQ